MKKTIKFLSSFVAIFAFAFYIYDNSKKNQEAQRALEQYQNCLDDYSLPKCEPWNITLPACKSSPYSADYLMPQISAEEAEQMRKEIDEHVSLHPQKTIEYCIFRADPSIISLLLNNYGWGHKYEDFSDILPEEYWPENYRDIHLNSAVVTLKGNRVAHYCNERNFLITNRKGYDLKSPQDIKKFQKSFAEANADVNATILKKFHQAEPLITQAYNECNAKFRSEFDRACGRFNFIIQDINKEDNNNELKLGVINAGPSQSLSTRESIVCIINLTMSFLFDTTTEEFIFVLAHELSHILGNSEKIYAPLSARDNVQYEMETDMLALYLLHRSGYDVDKYAGVWKTLSREKSQRSAAYPSNPTRQLLVQKTIHDIKTKERELGSEPDKIFPEKRPKCKA